MENEIKPKLVLGDGNAFAIIGEMKSAARKEKWPESKIKEMTSEAMAGDYNNVICTAGKYFDILSCEDEEGEEDWFEDEYDCEDGLED